MIAVSVEAMIEGAIVLALINFPVFVMTFLEKCVDLRFFRKKNYVTGKRGFFLLLDLLIIMGSFLMGTGIEYCRFAYGSSMRWNTVMLVLALFPFAVEALTLFLLYLIERRRFHMEPPKSALLKRSLGINQIIIFLFSAVHFYLTISRFFPAYIAFYGSSDLKGALPMQIVRSVAVILIFTVLKYIWQKRICKCGAERENTAEAEV